MKRNIFLENHSLVLLPKNYKILRYVLLLLLFILFPFFISIIYEVIESIKQNQTIMLNINEYYIFFINFYLLCVVGFFSLNIIKKHIPKKIIIDRENLKIIYNKNKEFFIPMDLWKYFFIYEFKYNKSKYKYFSLYNNVYNLKLDLWELTKKDIIILFDFFTSFTKLKEWNYPDFIITKNNFLNVNNKDLVFKEEIKNSKVIIRNRSKKYISIYFFIFIFISLFLLIFLKNFIKGEELNFFNYLSYGLGLIFFIIFYIFLLISFINKFFNTTIVKNHYKIFIYKEFFIKFIPIRFLIREFPLDKDLTLKADLFYDKKFSSIEIFTEGKSKKINLFNKNYYKISLFDYNINESLEIYNKIIYLIRN